LVGSRPAKWTGPEGRKVGQRQVDLANKLYAAETLTTEDMDIVLAQQIRNYSGVEG
jgi:hypothetical protein